ncbi:MAG: hypothetical protein IPK68_19385 [Bdellovibrionales bacterium]|nr:hypothetical protein [Bdellovibrionales bacterium]
MDGLNAYDVLEKRGRDPHGWGCTPAGSLNLPQWMGLSPAEALERQDLVTLKTV